jgi:hypothetical protein
MQFQYRSQEITWEPMAAPRQTWWHAAYSSAVGGAIRGLAAIVDSVPQRARHTA